MHNLNCLERAIRISLSVQKETRERMFVPPLEDASKLFEFDLKLF